MAVRAISVAAPTHGRVLVRDADAPAGTIVGFHGYGQNAADMLAELEKIPGAESWTLISIQALHRFYTRGDRRVVASWMTREDRDDAIADNVQYCDAALQGARETVGQGASARVARVPGGRLVFVGFSQGAAMAYRAGIRGRHRAEAIVAIGGDVPPDVKHIPAELWPRVIVCAGDSDEWFGPKVAADVAFLAEHGVDHDVVRYRAGHEITDDVRLEIARVLGLR